MHSWLHVEPRLKNQDERQKNKDNIEKKRFVYSWLPIEPRLKSQDARQKNKEDRIEKKNIRAFVAKKYNSEF